MLHSEHLKPNCLILVPIRTKKQMFHSSDFMTRRLSKPTDVDATPNGSTGPSQAESLISWTDELTMKELKTLYRRIGEYSAWLKSKCRDCVSIYTVQVTR
jgi:hypothetical protein